MSGVILVFDLTKKSTMIVSSAISVRPIPSLIKLVKFKSLHRRMIAAGVNPFVLKYNDETCYERRSVSSAMIAKVKPDLTTDLFFAALMSTSANLSSSEPRVV